MGLRGRHRQPRVPRCGRRSRGRRGRRRPGIHLCLPRNSTLPSVQSVVVPHPNYERCRVGKRQSQEREGRLETGETTAERLIAQFYGRGPPGRVLSCLARPSTSRPAPMLFLFGDESRLSLLEMRLVLFKLFSWRRRQQQEHRRWRRASPSVGLAPSLRVHLDLSIYAVSRQAGRVLSVRFSTFRPSPPSSSSSSFPHNVRPTSCVAEVERREARTRVEFRS